MRELFLFIAREPGEEEDCSSKAHSARTILFCGKQPAAPNMQEREENLALKRKMLALRL